MSVASKLFLAISLASLSVVASAQATEQEAVQVAKYEPTQPNDCVTAGASYHSVNPWIVRAILKVESNFDPKAFNKNSNGSVDVGIAQINSIHFKELGRYGIGKEDLMNGCVSSYVAAWHLRKQVVQYGNTWFAVGAYHSATPCYNKRYSGLVWNTLINWKAVTGTRVKVHSMDSCKSNSVSTARRSTSSAGESSLLTMDTQ